MKFSRDFSTALCADGETIRFTKSESRALAYLSSLPGRVVTRDQLLDAVSEVGSEKNDRSVDFLINRLRKKLSDSAKEPKYIASRYGEGYVWVAGPNVFSKSHGKVFILIGPLRWPSSKPELKDIVFQYALNLQKQLEDNCFEGQKIALDVDFDRDSGKLATQPDYTIDLTLVRDGADIAAISMVKSTNGARLVCANRFPLAEGELNPPADYPQSLLAKIWKDKATLHRDVPLPVAMNDVVRTIEHSDLSWHEAEARLKVLREASPDDPELKLMHAAHLHTKYVLRGPELFQKGTDTCEEDEKLIEQLVLDALPYTEAHPEHRAISAKLLHFLRKGYENRAYDLAEGAHAQSVNVASTLAAIGQLRGFRGDFSGAKECLEQAILLCDRGTDFHVYSIIFLIQVHLAANDKHGVAEMRKELYSVRPSTMIFFELLLTDPNKPSLRAKAATMMLTKRRAQGILKHIFYISGRLYAHDEHRENMMRCTVILFRRRFGRDVLTEEMIKAMPNLTS